MSPKGLAVPVALPPTQPPVVDEWVLRADNPATKTVEKVAVQYGAFINTVIQFVIVAFAVFMLVKLVNAMRRADAAAPEAPAAPTPTEAVLMEIRDLLKTQGKTPQ